MKASPITLEVLNRKIKGLIKDGLDSHWVIAEISELSVNYSGHCYLELIQKSEKDEHLVARARAVIWSNTFRMLRPYFETTTGSELTQGIKVMLRVVVEFHEVYGLSLNVVDIEPTYTVGELTVRKQKIIEKLQKEGVLEMNQELELPYLSNKIAIISSKTAAGLKDFNAQLENNPQGFKFYTKLFPAVMQGNEAEGSIIEQLDKVYEHAEIFDAVVIIRGGGASADLECFNSYWLAYNITQFPIPVLSGIGHEQDDTVVDMVANTRLKTPTAVAEFLIERTALVENDLLVIQSEIIDIAQEILIDKKFQLNKAAFDLQKIYSNHFRNETKKLDRLSMNYISGVKNRIYLHQKQLEKSNSKIGKISSNLIAERKYQLNTQSRTLSSELKISFTNNKHRLEKAEQFIKNSDPKQVLSRGYSITLKDGKSVKDAKDLKKGDEIETIFHKGKKKSIVK